MTSGHVRAYRALLRVYPAGFRAEYRDEMVRLFVDQLIDARAVGGRGPVLGLWARSVVDLVATAPGQHLEKEVLVASPAGAPDQPRLQRGDPMVRWWYLAAASPLLILVALFVVAPGFLDPMFANPPAIIGLPAGIVLLGVALALTTLGIWSVTAARSVRTRLFAIMIFTVPALALITFGPAIILIVQALAV